MSDAIRVLLADDHAIVREGLRTYLELQDRIEVVGEAADGDEAVRLAEALKPDVVLMDLVMPGRGGVAAMRELRRSLPQCRIVVLTSHLDDERLLPAIQAGAAGYLLKDAQPGELLRAIRAAHEGQTLLDPQVASRLVDAISQHPGEAATDTLTAREREVLALIARGYANKRIAAALGISEKTVKNHVSQVLAKLGVADRTQAALHAQRAGLLDS